MVQGDLMPKLGKTGLCDLRGLSAYTNKYHLLNNSRHVSVIDNRVSNIEEMKKSGKLLKNEGS
jgi:hypothetical protein